METKTFIKKAEVIIKKHGGKKLKDMIYPWEVKTKFGILFIDIPNWMGNLYTVFMRFKSPSTTITNEIPEVNPYSGKWNIHTIDAEYTLEELDWRLKKVK